ncbi:MAG: phage major capsid protein [Acidobacteriota bacterium]
MQITKTDLEQMIKEVVSPLIADGVTGAADGLAKEVEEKISEATQKLALARPKIELGDDNLTKDPKGGFSSISHFARDVYKATKAQFRNMTPELAAWTKAADTTTLRTDDSEYGGFLIPDEYRNELWLAVEQQNPLWPLVTHVPMQSNTVLIPYVHGFDESGGLVYGGVEWKWLDELASKTPTRPKLGRIQLTLHKMAGLAYASDEILEDSPQSMENILKRGFSDGLTFQLMKVLLRGTGSGQPLGIINAPCLVSVAKETGQTDTTIVSYSKN